MRRIESRRKRFLERVLIGPVAASVARVFRPINHPTLGEPGLRGYSEKSADRYVHHGEQTRVRLELLGMERHKAEGVDLARRCTCL